MIEYTRVTIQGSNRKADLVLSNTEPLASVLPDVLELLNETDSRSARPVALITRVGDQLDPSLTLAEQNIIQGSFLRLIRVDEAPPPPEIADVTDVVADSLETRRDVWGTTWMVAAAATVNFTLGAFGSAFTASLVQNEIVVLLVAIATLIAVATPLARRGQKSPAITATAAAAGISLTTATLLSAEHAAGAPGATALLFIAIVGIDVAVVAALGFRDTALTLGGAVAASLIGIWIGLHSLDWDATHSAALMAVLSCFLLGLLPGIAMNLSGLTGLDDRIVEGGRVSRVDAQRTVTVAHRSLTWATIATAIVAGASAWILAVQPETLNQTLAGAVGVILLLRIRVLPLVPQRLALMIAGGLPFLALLLNLAIREPAQAAAVAGILTVATIVRTALRPSQYFWARLRKLGTALELIAVLALIPLVLARVGVFADLLDKF